MEDAILDAGLQLTKNGGVAQTIGNCVKAILFDEKTRQMFKYNELSTRTEVHGAWWNRGESPNMTDSDVNFIRLFLETKYGLACERGIPRAIDTIAVQNSYHPIKEYLQRLNWDGKKHIENLFPRFLGAEKSEYTTEATKLFMIGAISRVFHPGTKFENVVCLVEPKQGGGKSTMARYMAINDDWFSDTLKNLDSENVYRYMQGHWIIEFSEMLATANAKTVEEIKSFISRQKDTYKVPYDKHPRDYARQCVFIGTTNNISFLPSDRTGNRRFIPLMIHSEQAELHPVEHEKEAREHVEKAWAEAMHYYNANEYTLTFPKHLQRTLDTVRQEFEPEDPKVGIIQEWLDNCEYDTVCSLMIYWEAFRREGEPKRYEINEIHQIMNSLISGWVKHPAAGGKRRIKGYGVQRAWNRVNSIQKVAQLGFSFDNDFIPINEAIPFD